MLLKTNQLKIYKLTRQGIKKEPTLSQKNHIPIFLSPDMEQNRR